MYFTAHEIDGHRGIKSPHARELEAIGQEKAEIFVDQKKRRIKMLLEEEFFGQMDDLGFDEDYSLTIAFFPEVKVHMLYSHFEADDDEPFEGAELKFLFSGDRVKWVPTEDLIGLIEATLKLFEIYLREKDEQHGLASEKSDLLTQSIQQRSEPFIHLQSEHLTDLALFIGCEITQTETYWTLSKSFFKNFTITLSFNQLSKELDLKYAGTSVKKLDNYSRDQLGIFLINHCLRFISITYPEVKMPKIVGQMFSYSYLKSF